MFAKMDKVELRQSRIKASIQCFLREKEAIEKNKYKTEN
jgi:hypothetical protein